MEIFKDSKHSKILLWVTWSESFCKPSKSAAKKKKGTKKKTSNRLMKHHQKWKFPLSGLISALTDIISTRKDAVCGIDKQGQVGCLISLVIIAMLLIDTSLSLAAASPVKTFDPHGKSLPERSPGVPVTSISEANGNGWGWGHMQSLYLSGLYFIYIALY